MFRSETRDTERKGREMRLINGLPDNRQIRRENRREEKAVVKEGEEKREGKPETVGHHKGTEGVQRKINADLSRVNNEADAVDGY